MNDTELKMYHAVAAGQLQPAAIAIRMRDGAPSTFARRLRRSRLAVDPDLHLRDIRSLDEALRSEQWIRRLEAAVIRRRHAECPDALVGGHLRTHVVHRVAAPEGDRDSDGAGSRPEAYRREHFLASASDSLLPEQCSVRSWLSYSREDRAA